MPNEQYTDEEINQIVLKQESFQIDGPTYVFPLKPVSESQRLVKMTVYRAALYEHPKEIVFRPGFLFLTFQGEGKSQRRTLELISQELCNTGSMQASALMGLPGGMLVEPVNAVVTQNSVRTILRACCLHKALTVSDARKALRAYSANKCFSKSCRP